MLKLLWLQLNHLFFDFLNLKKYNKINKPHKAFEFYWLTLPYNFF